MSKFVVLGAILIMAGCQQFPGGKAEAPPATDAAAPAATTAAGSGGGISTRPAAILPDGFRVWMEIAADDQSRAEGLMYRESVPAGSGMLFMFPQEGLYPFWMKNTYVPLDMIWMDSSGRVVDVKSNVPPCPGDPCPSFTPAGTASYVLELGAGEASKHGVKKGSAIRLENVEQYRAT
ncbi:MAG: DUF192 domain-containing protein [Thermoanaerobaculia bacterium]